jgi:hypothetical protein
MANRGTSYDPDVHTIADLKQLGSKRLPKMYSGKLIWVAQEGEWHC